METSPSSSMTPTETRPLRNIPTMRPPIISTMNATRSLRWMSTIWAACLRIVVWTRQASSARRKRPLWRFHPWTFTVNIAGTTTTYTYGTLGSLVLEKSKNHVVDYQYNELNQLVQKKDGNESCIYTYDKWGNRTAEIGKKASRSYVYDETNRMVERTNWKVGSARA